MESISIIGNSQANLGSLNSDIVRLSNIKNVEKCLNSSKKLQIGLGGRVKLINCPTKLSLRVSASQQSVQVPPEKFSGRKSVNSKPVSFLRLSFQFFKCFIYCYYIII